MNTTQSPNDPLAKFTSLPGALPTQPISHAKDGRGHAWHRDRLNQRQYKVRS